MEYFKKWLKEVNQFLPMIDDLQSVVNSYLSEFYFETSLIHFKNCLETKDAIYNEELLALRNILSQHVNNDEQVSMQVARISTIHDQSCFQSYKRTLGNAICKAKESHRSMDYVSDLIDDFLKWRVFENKPR